VNTTWKEGFFSCQAGLVAKPDFFCAYWHC